MNRKNFLPQPIPEYLVFYYLLGWVCWASRCSAQPTWVTKSSCRVGTIFVPTRKTLLLIRSVGWAEQREAQQRFSPPDKIQCPRVTLFLGFKNMKLRLEALRAGAKPVPTLPGCFLLFVGLHYRSAQPTKPFFYYLRRLGRATRSPTCIYVGFATTTYGLLLPVAPEANPHRLSNCFSINLMLAQHLLLLS